MRTRRGLIWILSAVIVLSCCSLLTSCGSTRAYWGVENEYYMGDDYGHHHKKPKHYKKYKKHHKKHHHHHHD